jgi:glycosyltransferase involved in cell wall biosynthesis
LTSIPLIVGGRFHADKLAIALEVHGREVEVLTTLPRARFPENKTTTAFLLPELTYRSFKALGYDSLGGDIKAVLFGKWVAHYLKSKLLDSAGSELAIGWSSFSLETLQTKQFRHFLLVRDSEDIRLQMELLDEEYKKRGLSFRKNPRVLEREIEEYALASHILVLSEFAKKSLVEKGVEAKKLIKIPLGVDTARFTPRLEWEPHKKFRALYFGGVSFRKGIPYLLDAIDAFPTDQVELTIIGNIDPELRRYFHNRRNPPRILSALPQDILARKIVDYDFFIFPTISDGFGMTLLQAMASGLIPLVTTTCGTAECIEEGKNGFLIEPSNSQSIKEKIEHVITKRNGWGEIRQRAIQTANAYSWEKYGDAVMKAVNGILKP